MDILLFCHLHFYQIVFNKSYNVICVITLEFIRVVQTIYFTNRYKYGYFHLCTCCSGLWHTVNRKAVSSSSCQC